MKKVFLLISLIIAMSFTAYSQSRFTPFQVPNKTTDFGVNLYSGEMVYEVDSLAIYILSATFTGTSDMADVFTSGNYDVIAKSVSITNITAVMDSLADHLDSLQTHNTRILAQVDTTADHLDTLQAHNTRILALVDTTADHLDTLQAHNTRILALVDTTADHLDTLQAHNTRILALVDTTADHLDTTQQLRADLNADINALGDTADYVKWADTVTKISTRYDLDTTYAVFQPLIDQLWYGIEWDVTSSATPVTQIGSATYLSSLPVHTDIKYATVKDNGTVNYYLDETNFNLKANGAASVLTGADGQVMMILPAFYERWEQDGNTVRYKISPYALTGFTLVPSYAIGVYEAKVVTGDTLSSISGQTPTTSKTRANFRTYAAKRNTAGGITGWSQLSYEAYKTLTMLYMVEKADWDSQHATAGLNIGATNATSVNWSEYNAYSPVMTVGQNNTSGAYTGSKDKTINNWYKGVASGTKTDTIVDAGRFTVASGIASWVGDTLINTTTGDSVTVTARISDDQLKVAAIGTGTGVFTTGNTYYILNSTLATKIAYYRGVENVFGHVWKFVDGINITNDSVYTNSTPATFADDTKTNYTLTGVASGTDGYIVKFIYSTIIPQTVGGSSSTYKADYYYQSSGWRVACWGGLLHDGTSAGLWFAFFGYSSGNAGAAIGARLCLKIE